MSSQNTFPGPTAGRPPARAATPASSSQPSWVNPQAQPQTGRPQQPAWPEQQPPQGYPDYPQTGASGQHQPQSPSPGQWSELQPNHGGGQPDPYAPQFEPYVPPSRPNFRHPSPNFPRPH